MLRRAEFETLFAREERAGILKIADASYPADKILARFDQMNLSTYVFRASVLYDALSRLKSTRANGEEYLTDVFEMLASRKKPARVVGCEIADPRDLMAFNNPQELLAIEEVYRQKEGTLTVTKPANAGHILAPASMWDRLLESPSAAARRQFRQWYGEEEFRGRASAAWSRHSSTATARIERWRSCARPAASIFWGGTLITGGTVNVMAINREVILVAARARTTLYPWQTRTKSAFPDRISGLPIWSPA